MTNGSILSFVHKSAKRGIYFNTPKEAIEAYTKQHPTKSSKANFPDSIIQTMKSLSKAISLTNQKFVGA